MPALLTGHTIQPVEHSPDQVEGCGCASGWEIRHGRIQETAMAGRMGAKRATVERAQERLQHCEGGEIVALQQCKIAHFGEMVVLSRGAQKRSSCCDDDDDDGRAGIGGR